MKKATKVRWFVYLVRCCDSSLYAGVTADLVRRLKEHNAGTGARYTRLRRPVHMVWSEPAATQSAALRREAAVKRLTRQAKERLALGDADPAMIRAAMLGSQDCDPTGHSDADSPEALSRHEQDRF